MKNIVRSAAAGLLPVLLPVLLAVVSVWRAEAQVPKSTEHRIAIHKAGIIARIAAGETAKPEWNEAADLLAGKPDEVYSYVATPANIEITGGAPVYADGVAIVRPGRRVLKARFVQVSQSTSGPTLIGNMMVTMTTTTTTYGNPVAVEADLEPDKFYTLRPVMPRGLAAMLDIDRIGVSVEEITGRGAVERARKKAQEIIANPEEYLAWVVTIADYDRYMEWWRAHLGELDGRYVSSDGRTEIRFAGERFEAYDRKALMGTTTFAYGSYMFDGRTIVLQTDSTKTTTLAAVRSRPGNEVVSIEKKREVLCYRLSGDVLEIPARTYNTTFDLGGGFRRQADSDTPAELPQAVSGDVTASGMASLDIAWRVEGGTLKVSGRGDVPGDPSWSSAIDRFTSAEVGDGITSLGHHAFAMSKITSLVLGKDVAGLKSYALFNCDALTTVEVRNPVPPDVGAFAFMSTPVSRARLIVPAGAKSAYAKDKNWGKFGTIEER
jgi:hypothetical protein